MYLTSIQARGGVCKPNGLFETIAAALSRTKPFDRRFVRPSVDQAGNLYDHIGKSNDHAVIVIR